MALLHKALVIILDGLGDLPNAALGWMTPLEAAHTPNLDRLAEAGLCGMLDPILPGVPVSTHTGAATLLGVPASQALRLARGPVEALGIGFPGEPGDVFLRCNFATLRPKGNGFTLVDRRAGRIQQGADQLAAVLQDVPLGEGVTASVRPATQHRAVLRLRGEHLSATISDTDPACHGAECALLESRPLHPGNADAGRTATALNRWSRIVYERLSDHPLNRERGAHQQPPANGLITRGAGALLGIETILRHQGVQAAVVSGERTLVGLAKLLGFTSITAPEFTALPSTDLQAKVYQTHAALGEHDLVFLHIKGTDICAHDRDPAGKKAFIERVDDAILPLLRSGLVVGVAADHTTDSRSGRHTGDPVPALLYVPGGRRDKITRFGESDCLGGGLGRLPATAFIHSVLDAMGALPKYRPADEGFYL